MLAAPPVLLTLPRFVPVSTPATVVARVARVATVPGVEATAFAGYPESRARFAHVVEIRGRYGDTPFGEGIAHWRSVRWLYDRAWIAVERPTVLVDFATAWLVEHKVLLPGLSTLARLIAGVRDRAARRRDRRRRWRHRRCPP
ncbi:MAG: DUF4158 domain-containing protein [Acidimicrobiales bacterium]